MTGGGSDDDILPDRLDHGLRVVFCGSAAGIRSARQGAYYAHPQNRFWPTLYAIGLTPRRLAPAEFPLLLRWRIGLTDLCKTASGADRDLPSDGWDRDRLARQVDHFAPAFVAFNGKAAAAAFLAARSADLAYGPLASIGDTRLFLLPSTSPAAGRSWDERWWQDLAALLPPLTDDDGG